MTSSHDLIVAGGGPIGLATALYAARAGMDVVVFEPRPGPVDKACGEGLMPGAVERLGALGVHPQGRPFHGIAYSDGRSRAESAFRHGHGLGVRRTTLHRALSDAAAEAGVEIVTARVGDVTVGSAGDDHAGNGGAVDGGGVTVGDRRARYLVAADGLHSPTRRRLGLDRPVATAHRWGLRRHFRIEPWSDLVEVYWPARGSAERSEAYVTPVADGLVGVAVLTERRGSFEEHLSAFPALRARLGGAAGTETMGAGPLRQRSRRVVDGPVLLVGDAAGYVDALTGEGIAVGLATAEVLVRCLRDGRPASYEQEWRRASRRYRALTGGLLWSRRRPWLAGAIVPAATRFPRVFTAAVGQLAR